MVIQKYDKIRQKYFHNPARNTARNQKTYFHNYSRMDEEPRRKVATRNRNDGLIDIANKIAPAMNGTNLKYLKEVANGETHGNDISNYKKTLAPFTPLLCGTKEAIKKLTSTAFKIEVLQLLNQWPNDTSSQKFLLDLLILCQFGWECTTGVTHRRTRALMQIPMDSALRKDALLTIR